MYPIAGWVIMFVTGLFFVKGGVQAALMSRALTGRFFGDRREAALIVALIVVGIILLGVTLGDIPFRVVPQ